MHDYESDYECLPYDEAFVITKIWTFKHKPFFLGGGGGGRKTVAA